MNIHQTTLSENINPYQIRSRIIDCQETYLSKPSTHHSEILERIFYVQGNLLSKVDEKISKEKNLTSDKEHQKDEAMNCFDLQECKIKIYSDKDPYEVIEEEEIIIPKKHMSRLNSATFSIDRRSDAN